MMTRLSLLAVALTISPTSSLSADDSDESIDELRAYVAEHQRIADSLFEQPFASRPLSREAADAAQQVLWESYAENIRSERAAEMQAEVIEIGELKMPVFMKKFGEKPDAGWSLYISMHGGGGAPARVNDGQWENQKRLYQLKEGIYLVPRAPTDTWNLWHQAHIDDFYDRLITSLIVLEGVNPDRVYIMGYSAGGDGVFQLAPRFADRLAAAAMMAGHPNETSPLGLRNLPFTIHMGELDAAYKRNEKAAEWKASLAKLREGDMQGYTHHVQIHPGKGHWMDRDDAVAIDWMSQFSRDRFPQRIVWKQDDVKHDQFYWLAVPKLPEGRPLIVATRDENSVTIESSDVENVTILLNDEMLDLDQPVTVMHARGELFSGTLNRTIASVARSILHRGDPRMVFSARVPVVVTPDDAE